MTVVRETYDDVTVSITTLTYTGQSAAEVCFNEAYLYGSSGVRELVDRGLLAIAQKNYEEACTSFQRASAIDPSNIMVNAISPAKVCSKLLL